MNLLTCSPLAMSMTGMYGAMQNVTNGFVTYTPGSMYMTASNPTAQTFASPGSTQLCPSVFRTAPKKVSTSYTPPAFSSSLWKKAMAAGVAFAGLSAVSTSAEAFPMDRPFGAGRNASFANNSSSPYAVPAALGLLGFLVLFTIVGMVWSSRPDGSSKKNKPS